VGVGGTAARAVRIASIFLSALLAACAVGPDYEPPPVDAPEAFVAQDVFALLNEGKEQAPLGSNWWEGFSDPMLSRLVEDALANNQEILAAAARLKAARANVRAVDARDALLTDVAVEGGAQGEEVLDGGGDSTDTGASASFGLNLPLDIFGRNRREVEAALAQLEAARADLRAVVLARSSAVAAEYLRLRGNQRQLDLLKESIALQEKTLSIVRSRYEAGLSPELDLRRAETSVERLRADLPPLVESLAVSRHALATLTGRYPGAYEEILKEAAEVPRYQYQITAAVPLDVLRNRPDIRAAEAALKQAVAEIGVAEADFYPLFNIIGSVSIGTGGVGAGPSMDILFGSLSALIRQVLTDGGARRANLDIAAARAEEALAAYRQALLEAVLSVENTLVALDTSLARQESLEKAVESSARSFQQADRLYQLGLSSFLDVVDAQRVLAAAEQQLASERTQYATQIATLFRVLGAPVEPPQGTE
jgi:multidrug efflux system outer membrane protein